MALGNDQGEAARWADRIVDEADSCAAGLHVNVRVEVEDVAEHGKRDDCDETDDDDPGERDSPAPAGPRLLLAGRLESL